jgi:hypothetical protein
MTTLPVNIQASAALFYKLELPPLMFKLNTNMRKFPKAVLARHANMDGFWPLLSAQGEVMTATMAQPREQDRLVLSGDQGSSAE